MFRRKKGGDTDSAKYRALLRKWMKNKKRLKLALMDLQDRTNYYKRQIAAFKKKQSKWLREQRALLKNSKELVKYIFIDDMVQVKFHSKHKDRVKIVTKKGQEVLIEKIKVVHEKGKKKKRKKSSAKEKEFMDDDPSWMAQDNRKEQLLHDMELPHYETSFFSIQESGDFSHMSPMEMNMDEDDDDFEDEAEVNS